MADDLIERLTRATKNAYDGVDWRLLTEAADRIRELEADRDGWKSASESILSDQAELGRILQDRIDQLTVERNGLERLARTAESRLAEAVVALEPFAEAAAGLEPRNAGGWHRVSKYGRKDVVFDLTFTDLTPLYAARQTLSRIKDPSLAGPPPEMKS